MIIILIRSPAGNRWIFEIVFLTPRLILVSVRNVPMPFLLVHVGFNRDSFFRSMLDAFSLFFRYHRVRRETISCRSNDDRKRLIHAFRFAASPIVSHVRIVDKRLHHSSIRSTTIICVEHAMKHVFHASVVANAVQ